VNPSAIAVAFMVPPCAGYSPVVDLSTSIQLEGLFVIAQGGKNYSGAEFAVISRES
jgi:hypothetical protein